MRYYTLTFLSSDARNKKGDRKLVGYRKVITIGTLESDDVWLANSTAYKEETILRILPLKEEGWCVLVHSRNVRVCVGGKETHIVTPILDKEHISIGDMELRFEVHDDDAFKEATGVRTENKRQSNKLLNSAVALLAVAVIAVAAAFMHSQLTKDYDRFTNDDIAQCENAVYHIYVDTIMLQRYQDGCWTNLEAMKPTTGIAGSCFLARESESSDSAYFVTARHCIEYWLADSQWKGEGDSTQRSREVNWAIMVENNNYPNKKEYRIVSKCSIVKDDVIYATFESSQCHFNKSRDVVSNVSGTEEPMFWRFLFPLFKNREMELGDFAYIQCPDSLRNKPYLVMADTLFYKERLKNVNSFMLFGFPDNNSTLNVVWKNDGKFQWGHSGHDFIEDIGEEGCLPLTVNANHGDSGGPVVVKKDNKLLVVGIMSKEDDHSKGATFWCVPINEVTRLLHQDSETDLADDEFQYLR